MVTWNEESKRVPGQPAGRGTVAREPIAPSKPTVPARSPATFRPEPIEVEESTVDILAPVMPPPPEEIMPTDSQAAWGTVAVFGDAAAVPAASIVDPIQSLGDAAVRRASLSASGAATPLGGVAPSVRSAHSAQAPATGEVPLSRSPYQPQVVANPASASAVSLSATAPGFMASNSPPSTQTPPATATPELEDNPVDETLAFSAPAVPDPSGGDASDGEEPPVKDERTPWWRSWPFLVLVGLLVMGGIAYAIFTAMSKSEPVELTPAVIVTEPEEATHEPISIDSPTAFQEALPQMVGLYALTGFESPDVDTLDLLERAAEANLLTYQYQDITLSVRAIQHFDTDTALRHFDAIAVDGTDRSPVSAGGIDVGERVTIGAEDSDTIVWRNTTAIFFVTGPADAAEEFFTQYPL